METIISSTEPDTYFTQTRCPGCGGWIDGVQGRYVCRLCGWLSPPDGPVAGSAGGVEAGVPPVDEAQVTDELVYFLRARFIQQREAAINGRLQGWQDEVADLNAKQAIVDDCERSAILAAGATRRVAELMESGTHVDQPQLVDLARLEGRAAALRHAVGLLALPYTRHPEYREHWRA